MPLLQSPIEGIFETHAHLNDRKFDADRGETLQRAREAGVGAIVNIGSGYGWEGNRRTLQLVEEWRPKFPNLYATIGIHPHEAAQVDERGYDELMAMARSPLVVGFGECGLDYFRNLSPKEIQKKRFRDCIRMAIELDLPLIIHDRDAHDDTLNLLKEEGAEKIGGVFHCFSGQPSHARRALSMGFYISIPGVVTYPNAPDLHQTVREIPIEKLLVETDCPYLTPHPHRGRRNEPSFLPYVIRKIAELKAPLTEADVTRITAANAARIFRLEAATQPRIAYPIRDSLYLNLTNRCTLRCKFCGKWSDYTVKGHYLKIESEPSIEELQKAIGDPKAYAEVVFCGYGEPTLRIEEVKTLGRWIKSKGGRVRLNTDGLANLVYGRNVLSELEGAVDAMSVSLNAADGNFYDEWCPSAFKGRAYPAVLSFIREAVARFEVTATVVGLPGLDIEACRRIAEKELGASFRFRPQDDLG